jgi:hypothetical protein
MKRGFVFTAVLLISLFPQGLMAQEVLTNDAIIKLTKAGLSEELIVKIVQTQPGKYLLGTEDLLRLTKEGATDRVIRAMLDNSAGPGASPVALSRTPAEIGIYLIKGEEWSELQPEVVNWKQGGVLKSFATAGVIRGDVNGHIEGKGSPNRITTALHFLIVAPEGTAVTEYQLLKLNQHSDNREFRAVTGGVFHAKGGATRDLVRFDGKKVGQRTFVVTLSGLTKGEYGFLPPGFLMSSSSAATLGKIYSFGVEDSK